MSATTGSSSSSAQIADIDEQELQEDIGGIGKLTEQVRAKANRKLCVAFDMLVNLSQALPPLTNLPKTKRDIAGLVNKTRMSVDYAAKVLRRYIASTVDAKIERAQLERLWQEEDGTIHPSDIMVMNNFFGEDILPTVAPPIHGKVQITSGISGTE